MILGSGLIQSGTPAFGTLAADSSDSALLAGQDALVCVYDGAAYIYFGKASGTWKTLWADTTGALLRGDEAGTYAVTLASDGPAPFDVAYAFATDRKAGTVAQETTFSHAADCLVQFTATLPSSGQSKIDVRMAVSGNDADCWRIVFDNTGTYTLFERVTSSPTQRAQDIAAITTGQVLTIMCDATVIAGYHAATQSWSYPSASNFATATNGQIDTVGAGSAFADLVSWPRSATVVAAILDKASA